MAEVARSFAASLLHLLRRRMPIDWSVVRGFVRARPQILLEIIAVPLLAQWRKSRKP